MTRDKVTYETQEEKVLKDLKLDTKRNLKGTMDTVLSILCVITAINIYIWFGLGFICLSVTHLILITVLIYDLYRINKDQKNSNTNFVI
ncbi:hypothetical protein [Natranaerobius trueperi]|uniref:Uncharacterized protein n=1 Tax=Natranaerobius trueperi TaxID=759412 RepID=A0A226BZ00_9FIRM|nr:hypothetical protein [Natranaerobius trueperi]OWZ83429.1 hypothetical protein CDO51_08540 [Natranaerobius trueperi]